MTYVHLSNALSSMKVFISSFFLLHWPSESDKRMVTSTTNLQNLLEQQELIPQAVIKGTLSELSKRLNFKVEKNHDDFDEYVGAGFWLEGIPFALMRYTGHPPKTYTLYLPADINELDQITGLVKRITAEFGVANSVQWQRQDNPDL